MKVINNDGLLSFYCPGCHRKHFVNVATEMVPLPTWSWNGSLETPTLIPSVLVTYDGRDAGIDGAPPSVCHSFVTDGQIKFLNDCTHDLAGQTVTLPSIDGY